MLSNLAEGLIMTYEYELVILSVEVVEMVSPKVFCITRIDEAMAVW